MIGRFGAIILIHLSISLLIGGCANLGTVDQQIPRRVGDEEYQGSNGVTRLPVRIWGKPEIDAAGKPRPAAVLLHGCGGWYGDNIPDWGSRLAESGWVAVAVDSLAVRNAPACKLGSEPYPSNFERRVDAYAALEWLANKPYVDADRIAVVGFSDGGHTAIGVVTADVQKFFYEGDGPSFAASVAYYPGCDYWERPRLSAPTQIIVGSEDDWTPPEPCRHWSDVDAGDDTVDVRIIEGATHAFDLHTWHGEILESRTYMGHRLTPNSRAQSEAVNYATDFLSRHVADVEP